MARRDDDDQPWLQEGVREERSTLVPRARLFGGGLLAVLLAVLVGLGVYFASGHKSDGSGGYATPAEAPLIAADAGPYKVAPDNPGGAQITGIDETIAAAAAGRDPGSAVLPDASEEPLARPGTGSPPPTDLVPPTPIPDARVVAPAAAPARVLLPAAPAVSATPRAVAPAALPPAKDAVAPVKPVATPKPVAPPAKPPAADKPADKPAHEPRSKPADPLAAPDPARAATFDPADKPAKAAPKPAKSDAGGSVTLQLGAFSTREKADAAWAKAGSDGALSGLTKRIEPVDRDGATLYRLRAGGVASPDAAKALCARLKAAGAACIVAG